MKKYSKFITGLFLIAAILAGSISSRPVETLAADPGTMEVHFLDVGQGNSTLITCDGHSMLIDAGEDSKGTLIQNYLNKQKVESLDYLVLTHPDSDHIGGAPVIISKFEINKVFVSNYEKDNKTYQKLIQSLDNKRLKSVIPDVGAQYTLGKATITFLAPNDEYDNPNDSSVALLVQNGENRFLFTGDAQEAAEKDILAAGLDISADVYLAGHHGSNTSTCEEFFEAVNPSCAVISCEEGNSYGHPHAQTLNTFRTNRVKVYRTDEDGTIIATSDGKKITFNVPASETWKAGEPTRSASSSAGQTSSAGTSAPSKNSVSSVNTPASDSRADTPAGDAGNIEDASNANAAPQPQIREEAPPAAETLQEPQSQEPQGLTYVLNIKTKKFHLPSCSSLPTTNRQDSTDSRETILSQGYVPCKRCNP